MSFYRRNPLFAFALLVCGVLALGEIALIYERTSASREAARRLAQRHAELQAMAALTPAPSRENAAAIQADLAKAQAALAAMRAELEGRGDHAERIRRAKPPVARTDAFFDLASLVEKMRELARKHEVDIRPEAARFGFSAYANEGPPQDHIEPVFRQRQVAQYLVESLLEARPRALLTIQRERPLGQAEREARAAALANGEIPAEPAEPTEDGPDYFAIDPRVTARVPGTLDTMAFRFVFTGQTAALRAFLNQLAAFELPVLVREVEVGVATAEEATAPSGADDAAAETQPDAAASAPPASIVLSLPTPTPKSSPAASRGARAPPATNAPIVAKTLSKFTVVVEFVELVSPVPPAPPEASPASPPS